MLRLLRWWLYLLLVQSLVVVFSHAFIVAFGDDMCATRLQLLRSMRYWVAVSWCFRANELKVVFESCSNVEQAGDELTRRLLPSILSTLIHHWLVHCLKCLCRLTTLVPDWLIASSFAYLCLLCISQSLPSSLLSHHHIVMHLLLLDIWSWLHQCLLMVFVSNFLITLYLILH